MRAAGIRRIVWLLAALAVDVAMLAGCARMSPPAPAAGARDLATSEPSPPGSSAAAPAARQEERADLGRFFAEYGVRGTFVLFDACAGKYIRYNPERARQRFLPASTFKIFNSLVALETGAVRDELEVIPWDSVVRGNAGWDQDQRMREAFQRSAVWFYQELARRIGEQRMGEWLARESYGNEDMAGGIDQFWLRGGLRISADEHIEFLRRLHDRKLGFSPEHMDVVVELMRLERGDGFVLRGKTGWAVIPDAQIGWLVGWVERGDDVYFYAMNLEAPRGDFPMMEARRRITRGILAELGVLPA